MCSREQTCPHTAVGRDGRQEFHMRGIFFPILRQAEHRRMIFQDSRVETQYQEMTLGKTDSSKVSIDKNS